MDESKIIRKCVSCNLKKSRADFIKITINKKTKEYKVNPTSDFVGRSVYVCKDISCINALFKKEKIYKILKIKPDETLKEKIKTVLEN